MHELDRQVHEQPGGGIQVGVAGSPPFTCLHLPRAHKKSRAGLLPGSLTDRTGCRHPPITSYFYWVWNAGSLDTGGILNMDWRSIAWERVDLLSRSLGLSPWYKYAPTAKG